MALALKQEEYTIEDIYNLPEGERAELIDGQMYMMTPPIWIHQRLVIRLSQKDCQGAPDWIIEIVSPGSRNMDLLTKLIKYKDAGVREYWAIDYEKKSVIVWSFERGATNVYGFDQSIPVGIYEDLEINISKLKK